MIANFWRSELKAKQKKERCFVVVGQWYKPGKTKFVGSGANYCSQTANCRIRREVTVQDFSRPNIRRSAHQFFVNAPMNDCHRRKKRSKACPLSRSKMENLQKFRHF